MIGTLIRTTAEAEEVRGFWIKLAETFPSFRAGQYIMLSFPETPDVKKAFSVVAYDKKKSEAFIIVKKNGEFTSKLFLSADGQEFNVYGPYGRFTLPDEKEGKNLVFIAGGIGITPLYSMLNYTLSQDLGPSHRIYLYYSAKSKEKAPLLRELNNINDERIKVDFRLTEDGDKRFTCEEIKENVPDFGESIFYICGPTQMIDGFRNGLMKMNIDGEMIKSEEFS
jgi:sulfhydrogenase subunit gamma (sulfur reductase)